MNYELANQLKDAGFPQHTYHPDGSDGDCYRYMRGEACVPTLEELIEACGKGFISLWRYEDSWEMIAPDGNSIIGSTPIEAVAKLWIELQMRNNMKKTQN